MGVVRDEPDRLPVFHDPLRAHRAREGPRLQQGVHGVVPQ